MTIREIDIDDDLLTRARVTLGTRSVDETVRMALETVVDRDPGAAYVKLLGRLPTESATQRADAWRFD